MDSKEKTLLLDLIELCRKIMKCASESRLAALRIQGALLKAGVPGYFEGL
jgi:hypothetical protein